MTAERSVAPQRAAIEYALELARRRQRAVEGRSELRETLVVGTMNGDVDAKALLDAIDELLANPTPTSTTARLLPSRRIGVMAKMARVSRAASTPTIALPF